MGSATQELQQNVSQKYGWSCHYDKDTHGHWYVEVVVGMNDNKYRFTAPNNSNSGDINNNIKAMKDRQQLRTKKQRDQYDKAEKEVVSAMALDGLAPHIANEEAKKQCQLSDVFPNPITIYDSTHNHGAIWKQFWKDPPQCVGIDTEGNQTSPPVLVQISTSEYTILEAPPRGNKSLSTNLIRLLHDNNITKIFCDNFSHADKIALGMKIPSDLSEYVSPPIIDLEVLSGHLYGVTKVARGLAKIVSMSLPELSNVQIVKPKSASQRYKNIGRFALIEQGKARPLRGVNDLSEREQQYCALDSWCTLQAYLSIMKKEKERSGGRRR
jgi:hypothetical protein